MKFSLRNNSLVILSAVAFIAVLVMAVMNFDVQYYQKAKKDLIEDKYFSHLPVNDQNLLSDTDVLEYLQAKTPSPQLEKKITQSMEKFFKGDLPIVSVRIVRPDGDVLLERKRPKGKTFNTFKNSLVLRDFYPTIKRRVKDPKDTAAFTGDLIFTYTSPLNFKPVEDLTLWYWGYLAMLLTALCILYFWMLRLLILPIKKVTEAIQNSRAPVAQFISKPRSRLERLYNAMARDALLNSISNGLNNPRTRQLRMTLIELFDFLEPRIIKWFGFDHVWLFELNWESQKTPIPVRQLPTDRDGAPAWKEVSAAFDPALLRDLQTSRESKTPHLFRSMLPQKDTYVFAGIIPSPESDSLLRVLTLVRRGLNEREQLAWFESTAGNIYQNVIDLVERQIGQSKELFREKSEANISLSRNLGHDLTNIIATNKLELLTVSQIIHGDPSTWFDTPEKTEILRESLTRLLDNTRTLQQIVNLYRAYEYLKSPRYEVTNLNKLIEELVAIFRLSMSAPVDISCEFDPDLPLVEIEPRLVKLALFNLLSNAQDAVHCLATEEQGTARIVLQTLSRDKEYILVRVSDTGPGIRTPDGNLAGPDHIEQIFDLGYTTKAGGDGEGLGLNWVRTILTEFHSGDLTAYNNPKGGATFEFSLPVAKEDIME